MHKGHSVIVSPRACALEFRSYSRRVTDVFIETRRRGQFFPSPVLSVLPELAEKLVPGNRLALRVRPSFSAFASGGIEVSPADAGASFGVIAPSRSPIFI